MSMPKTIRLYTYAAIATPLTKVLTDVIERQVAAWGPTLDDTIAEMLVRALAANDAPAEHHMVLDRADVFAWCVQEGEQSPYVVQVEGPEMHVVHTFVPDTQPATLEALVEHLWPRDDRP
jgi:hypothetical protein